MKTLHVRIADLDMSNAKSFERLAESLPDVLSTDIWTGRAELGISRSEAADDIVAALRAAGYDVTEAIVHDRPEPAASPSLLKFAIDGMTCHSCELTVERRLKKVPGVKKVEVDVTTGSAVIVAAEGADLDLVKLRAAL